jgi:hypothetical protein
MSVCETTHWTLDCGAGHGCYLVEYSDTGQLAGWGCSSDPVTGRPRSQGEESRAIESSRAVEFCVSEMSPAVLAEAVADLFPMQLEAKRGDDGEQISQCVKGTAEEVLREIGLATG